MPYSISLTLKRRYLIYCLRYIARMSISYADSQTIEKLNNVKVFKNEQAKKPKQEIQNRLKSSMSKGD